MVALHNQGSGKRDKTLMTRYWSGINLVEYDQVEKITFVRLYEF